MNEATKQAVRDRAENRCEYCHLPAAHVTTPFNVEHVRAKQHRGDDDLSNLCYACLRCNLHKGPNLTGMDPEKDNLTRLFNPRRQVWARHFRISGSLLMGRTAIGRTTIEVLSMNGQDRVALRQELLDQGLFPLD